MTKKEFALSQIYPYYKDDSLCGIVGTSCGYLTPDGKMCVLGKNLIDPGDPRFMGLPADEIFEKFGQDILKLEVRGILSVEEWQTLQTMHDTLANGSLTGFEATILDADLFTIEELENYEPIQTGA